MCVCVCEKEREKSDRGRDREAETEWEREKKRKREKERDEGRKWKRMKKQGKKRAMHLTNYLPFNTVESALNCFARSSSVRSNPPPTFGVGFDFCE